MQDIKEYWINVFKNCQNIPLNARAREISRDYSISMAILAGEKPIYRIHVKMKPKEIIVSHPSEIPKDLPIGTKVRIVAPKWAYDIHESWKWL